MSMKQIASSQISIRAWAIMAFGVCLFAASAGLAFAGWMEHASAIVMTLAENGMAWCF